MLTRRKGQYQSRIVPFASFACQTADNCAKSYWITLCSNGWSTMAGLQCHAIENKNLNHLINQIKNLGYEKWLKYKETRQDLGLCGFYVYVLFGEVFQLVKFPRRFNDCIKLVPGYKNWISCKTFQFQINAHMMKKSIFERMFPMHFSPMIAIRIGLLFETRSSLIRIW